MSTAVLTAYVLVWPVLVAVVLFVIGRGFLREWAEARRDGRDLI
ncbi:putative transporter small subunit [Streptomyces sp. NPDC006967]|nr:putative transporter small subunit [Streptomyces sp. SM1]